MRICTGAALLVVLAAGTGCGVSSDAHPAQGVPYTQSWKPLPASYLSTAACEQADWRCMPALAAQLGKSVLGPAKASKTSVVGVTYNHSAPGRTESSFFCRISRPGGGEPANLYESTSVYPDLAGDMVKGGDEPVQVQGSVGLFGEHATFDVLAWDQDGLGLQLSIRKSPGSPAPTKAELVALADALVPYKA
jgi:hypothetical protein